LADRHISHHPGLLAIAQVSHRPKFCRLSVLGFRSDRGQPLQTYDTSGKTDTIPNSSRLDRDGRCSSYGEIACPWAATGSLMIDPFATIRRPTLAVEGALWHSRRIVCNPEAISIQFDRVAECPASSCRFGLLPEQSARAQKLRAQKTISPKKPWKCRCMESMESHKAGFPPFPHTLEIPAGIPTLPQLRRRLSFD